MEMIEVKLLYGPAHGKTLSVNPHADTIRVQRFPEPELVASVTGPTRFYYDVVQYDEYIIHRLPSGRRVGIHTNHKLSEVIDIAIDKL